jgi:hypothetical protein
MKALLVFAVFAVSLGFGVANVSASQTFSTGIYGNTPHTCGAGSTDTSGARYGTFTAVETHNDQVVEASVGVDNLFPNRTYRVDVTEFGRSCLTMHNVISFTTNDKGKAVIHFEFWAHTYETAAWVTLQHGTTSDIRRSVALPINR